MGFTSHPRACQVNFQDYYNILKDNLAGFQATDPLSPTSVNIFASLRRESFAITITTTSGAIMCAGNHGGGDK